MPDIKFTAAHLEPRGTSDRKKGATPEMVEQLEAELSRLRHLVSNQCERDILDLPGAGAAGGLAAGL